MCSSISQKCNSKTVEGRIIFHLLRLDSENIFKPKVDGSPLSQNYLDHCFPLYLLPKHFHILFFMQSTNQNIFNKCVTKPEPITFLPLLFQGQQDLIQISCFPCSSNKFKHSPSASLSEELYFTGSSCCLWGQLPLADLCSSNRLKQNPVLY